MGWFEKIDLTPPSEEELSRPERGELRELERELKQERQELAECLADIYDEAEELGIDLDNGYEAAGNENYHAVKSELMELRAKTAMLLDEAEKISAMLKEQSELLETVSTLRGADSSEA